MAFEEVDGELAELEQRTDRLIETDRVNPATSTLLRYILSGVEEISDTIELVDPVHQENRIAAISRELLFAGAILRGIENFDRNRWGSLPDLLSELSLRVLGPNRSIDTFVLESPFGTRSLEVRIHVADESSSLILLLSPNVDFVSNELRGLVAHEVAHADSIVASFSGSYSVKRRKTGQFLADTLGFILLGPAFPYSLTKYAVEVRGVDESSLERPRSPSIGCRLQGLDHLNGELWTENSVKAFSELVFQEFRSAGISISQIENAMMPYYLREGRMLVEKRRTQMIDEEVIGAFLREGHEALKGPTPRSIELNIHVIGEVQS